MPLHFKFFHAEAILKYYTLASILVYQFMCLMCLQNLRDALDCIYDAKVPKVWGKVYACTCIHGCACVYVQYIYLMCFQL